MAGNILLAGRRKTRHENLRFLSILLVCKSRPGEKQKKKKTNKTKTKKKLLQSRHFTKPRAVTRQINLHQVKHLRGEDEDEDEDLFDADQTGVARVHLSKTTALILCFSI